MAGPTWIERRVSLRWRDVDLLGHVNHSLYLSFMSEARDRLAAAALGPRATQEFVVVRIEIDYVSEVRLEHEWVTARSSLLRVGNSSIRTADEVVRPDGVVAARAEAISVLTDRSTLKSRPFTPEERAALEALL